MINKKNKLLLLSIGILLIASYYLAIKNTFQLKNEYSILKRKSEQFKNIPLKLGILNQKKVFYDSILDKMDLNDTSIQNNLIRTINQEAKKYSVKVMDLNPPHQFQLENTIEYTYSFDLDGNFTDILKILYELEKRGNFGEIIHLEFDKKKNYKTGSNHLNASVLLQLHK
ncbi:hypothetical protein SAMN04488009_2841 [Maribacter sedimenticola]|uniref:Type II secretion system (T2SS), protein M subtype b n=1 Tax=Maribacter sedimenticola TaxID=228956 RepID=A0ABY1SJ77_9FLAO|nr:hypothetical protein [Maribacter sedimenticola]SNR63013.1 hypothetical protein SAMN04488009_2841 [Maribacter sedimenticola]